MLYVFSGLQFLFPFVAMPSEGKSLITGSVSSYGEHPCSVPTHFLHRLWSIGSSARVDLSGGCVHCRGGGNELINALTLACACIVGVVDVDEAMDLYEWGDIPGAIHALEELVLSGTLSFDERLRAYDRLGSAYYAMGRMEMAREAYLELLSLDSHYDLNPGANPRLRELLGDVRSENIATAMISTVPDGALVTVDGELLGVAPLSIEGLTDGTSYEVVVYASGYRPESMVLEARGGLNHQVSLSLLPALPDTSSTAPAHGADSVAASVPGDSVQHGSGQFSTTGLVNLITSTEAGLDVGALADQGAFESYRESSLQLSGTERIPAVDVQSLAMSSMSVEPQASGLMVFADAGSGEPTSVSGVSSDRGSSRDAEDVMAVLAEQQTSVTYIYNKHLRNDPLLSGTVVVEIVIQPSGRVSEVSILDSNTYNPAFELELAREIQNWRFGAVDENEGPLVVVRPFNFSGGF